MACPIPRKYPPKQPPAWKPPVPRWQLVFPSSLNIEAIHTIYVGVQTHSTPNPALAKAIAAIKQWLVTCKPAASDSFITEETLAHDIPGSRVWVAYFTSTGSYESALKSLNVGEIYRSLPTSSTTANGTSPPTTNGTTTTPSTSSHSTSSGPDIGLWTESFTTPLQRLETNYAGLHETPGLAAIPGTTREYHELSAYWGAARDRIPASGDDLFELPGSELPAAVKEGRAEGEELRATTTGESSGGGGGRCGGRDDQGKKQAKTTWHVTDDLSTTSSDPSVQYPSPATIPRGYGQRLTGTNYDNMTHIRSGQCWDQCPLDEAEAYTRPGGLQEKLMKGMAHLWSNAHETGTLGLRWLRNVREEDRSATTATNGHVHVNGDQQANQQRDETAEPKTINETCGAGFFRNLKDLENWSSTHPSHMAIFTGAHKHAREWGKDRKFMTWHEVSVLKKGEARWEYVNCDPRTGVVRFVGMEGVEELGG